MRGLIEKSLVEMSNQYVVRHDFRKYNPGSWGASYKKPFGDKNQGRIVVAKSEDDAMDKMGKKYRLNTFYLEAIPINSVEGKKLKYKPLEF